MIEMPFWVPALSVAALLAAAAWVGYVTLSQRRAARSAADNLARLRRSRDLQEATARAAGALLAELRDIAHNHEKWIAAADALLRDVLPHIPTNGAGPRLRKRIRTLVGEHDG